MNYTTFDQIQTGKKFKVPSGVTYQKISTTVSKPIKKADGTLVDNGRVTTLFYNSTIKIVEVN